MGTPLPNQQLCCRLAERGPSHPSTPPLVLSSQKSALLCSEEALSGSQSWGRWLLGCYKSFRGHSGWTKSGEDRLGCQPLTHARGVPKSRAGRGPESDQVFWNPESSMCLGREAAGMLRQPSSCGTHIGSSAFRACFGVAATV